MPTPIESAAAVVQTGLVVWEAWGGSVDQFNAWMMGDETGGPFGDGRYPMTNRAGTVVYVRCPAAQVAALSAASVMALPAAAVGEALPIVPGVAADGTLKRFPLDLFASRRTIDLEERSQILATDYLQVTTPTGAAFKVPSSSLSKLVGGIINITQPPYNCVGDWKIATNAAVATGSDIVQCANASWAAEDVGKPVFIYRRGTSATLISAIILEVHSATEIRMSVASTYTRSNAYVGWGTDNTAGLVQAFLDAAPKPNQQFGGVVLIPPGQYMTGAQYLPRRTGIFGYGMWQSRFVRKPTTSSRATLSNENQGDDYPIITNFGIDGNKNLQPGLQRGYQFTGPSGQSSVPFPYWQGMSVTNTSADAFVQTGAGGGVLQALQVVGAVDYGYKSAAYDMDIADLYVNGCSAGGVYFTAGSAGNSLSNCKISFNGQSPYSPTGADSGMNLYDAGADNQYNNVRLQESWGDNAVFAGARTSLRGLRCEDTGDINIQLGLGPVPGANRPRAALRMLNTAVDLDIDAYVTHAIPSGHSTNCATHAVYFSGTPTAIEGTVRTQLSMRTDGSYYAGGINDAGVTVPVTTGVYAPGVFGHDSAIDPSNDGFAINRVAIT